MCVLPITNVRLVARHLLTGSPRVQHLPIALLGMMPRWRHSSVTMFVHVYCMQGEGVSFHPSNLRGGGGQQAFEARQLAHVAPHQPCIASHGHTNATRPHQSQIHLTRRWRQVVTRLQEASTETSNHLSTATEIPSESLAATSVQNYHTTHPHQDSALLAQTTSPQLHLDVLQGGEGCGRAGVHLLGGGAARGGGDGVQSGCDHGLATGSRAGARTPTRRGCLGRLWR